VCSVLWLASACAHHIDLYPSSARLSNMKST
jgi:hypothetical protein